MEVTIFKLSFITLFLSNMLYVFGQEEINYDRTIKKYFVAEFIPNQNLEPEVDKAEIQRKHMNYIKKMASERKLVLAGPFEKGGGLFFINSDDSFIADSLIKNDPSVLAGINNYKLRPWYTEKGLFALEKNMSFDMGSSELPKNKDFSFWVGKWEVYKTGTDTIVGMSNIESILKGKAIKESYYVVKGNYRGTSINTYVEDAERWEQFWVDNTGLRLHLKGNYIDGKMVLSDCDENPADFCSQITWFAEAENVRQIWRISRDKGDTWQVAFDGTYKKSK